MTAEYLGTLGKWDFFIATAYGEYRDTEAVREIQRARYRLIVDGRTNENGQKAPVDIFCTAITLDHDSQRETSAFDDLTTTYHVFAIGNDRAAAKDKGELGCACAYAFESREKDGQVVIGLPQENKVDNLYPRGFDLDGVREMYTYDGRKTRREERVELFRHFKPPEYVGDKAASFGVYKSGIDHFISKRRREGRIPATKWFFCSKPSYYQYLYRPFGAMLTRLLLAGKAYENASPPIGSLKRHASDNGAENGGGLFYKGAPVSYKFPIMISRSPDEARGTRWFNFIPQIVDLDRASAIVRQDKYFRRSRHLSQVAWRIIAEALFLEHHDSFFDRSINYVARRMIDGHPREGWV